MYELAMYSKKGVMTTCNACEKQKIQTLSADDLVTLSLVQLRKLEYRSKHFLAQI